MRIPIIVGFISYIIPQENCTTLVLTNHEYASKHMSHVIYYSKYIWMYLLPAWPHLF